LRLKSAEDGALELFLATPTNEHTNSEFKGEDRLCLARRGIVMEAISSYFLPRLIGYSRAMHLITTGAVYPSTSPLFQTLFSEIVEPGDVLPKSVGVGGRHSKEH
jgi:hypothetical protein